MNADQDSGNVIRVAEPGWTCGSTSTRRGRLSSGTRMRAWWTDNSSFVASIILCDFIRVHQYASVAENSSPYPSVLASNLKNDDAQGPSHSSACRISSVSASFRAFRG